MIFRYSVLAGDSSTANLSLTIVEGKLVVRKPEAARAQLETFGALQSAFHTFMTIFLAKHPHRSAELLKYCEVIRMASIQFPGLSWKHYDEQFRLRQEKNPMRSWGSIDMELWLTVAAVGVAGTPTGFTNTATEVLFCTFITTPQF